MLPPELPPVSVCVRPWGVLHYLWTAQAVFGKWPKTEGKGVRDREILTVGAYIFR